MPEVVPGRHFAGSVHSRGVTVRGTTPRWSHKRTDPCICTLTVQGSVFGSYLASGPSVIV